MIKIKKNREVIHLRTFAGQMCGDYLELLLINKKSFNQFYYK